MQGVGTVESVCGAESRVVVASRTYTCECKVYVKCKMHESNGASDVDVS